MQLPPVGAVLPLRSVLQGSSSMVLHLMHMTLFNSCIPVTHSPCTSLSFQIHTLRSNNSLCYLMVSLPDTHFLSNPAPGPSQACVAPVPAWSLLWVVCSRLCES